MAVSACEETIGLESWLRNQSFQEFNRVLNSSDVCSSLHQAFSGKSHKNKILKNTNMTSQNKT